MYSRIIHFLHVTTSILFMIGIVGVTIIYKTAGEFHAEVNQFKSLPVTFVVFGIGVMAVLLGFVTEKTEARPQGIREEDKQQNLPVENEHLEEVNHTLDVLKMELDNILAMEGDNEHKSSKALNTICNRLHAGQGILFKMVYDENLPKLRLYASYAYVRSNDHLESFDLSDGLVGLAAKEDREIVLNDVPSEKLNICSGLGKSAPRALHIVPVRFKNELKGVLELAFFNPLDNSSKKVLQDIIGKLGAIL